MSSRQAVRWTWQGAHPRGMPARLLQRLPSRNLERLGDRQGPDGVAVAVLELDRGGTVLGGREAHLMSAVAQIFVDAGGSGDLLEHVRRGAAPTRDDVEWGAARGAPGRGRA